MSKQRKSAAELMAELSRDSDFQQRCVKNEVARSELESVLEQDEREIMAECRAAGYNLRSVWDLVNAKRVEPTLFPILISHLTKNHHVKTQEAIVRALTTPSARGHAFLPLVQVFREIKDKDSELKWLVGAAIAETATAADCSTVLELVNNEEHGRGRAFLPLAFTQLGRNDALEVLIRLSSHPDMEQSARRAQLSFK